MTDRLTFYIGTGTCGLGAGAGATLERLHEALAEAGAHADVVEVGCIGLCAAEPLVDVALPGRPRVAFPQVTPDRITALVREAMGPNPNLDGAIYQHGAEDLPRWPDLPVMEEHPFFKDQTRLVLENCGVIDPGSLEDYLHRKGYAALRSVLTTITSEELIAQVEESGLRGRGGGGFPTGRKWRFAAEAGADRKFLVCNADEGDPGAFMDRAVIEGDPHRLIEGMALAMYAIGASDAYVYIRAEYPLAIRRLEIALEQAREAGFLGEDVLATGNNLRIKIKKGAGAFVCGEETALIHSIEGRRGMPRPRPPYPVNRGLFGKPTVINNVETLANLPWLLRNGPDAFAALGTESSRGTKVFALSGKVARPGLVEVEMGLPVRQIVDEIGGGVPGGRNFKAVLIGGPSGGCIPKDQLDVAIDYESLGALGAMMGSGGLVVMDEDNCMVDVARFFMEFIQKESCGKCIPCREGTRQMLEILTAIVRHPRDEQGFDALDRFQGILQLERLARVIRDTSLCGLGQSAPNPVLSTLRWFRDEYEAHIFDRHCPAGACRQLLEYRIDPERCNGCTLCATRCPADAIRGAKKSPHYIVPERCIGCGTCLDACRAGAVLAS